VGIRVTHLAQDRRTLTIPIGDDELKFIYRPGGFTAETEDLIHEQIEGQRYAAAVVQSLSVLLIEWDVLDDKGKAKGVDPKFLRTLPVSFLGQVFRAIQEDMRGPLGTSDETSAATS
jgi:hypothetical protein